MAWQRDSPPSRRVTPADRWQLGRDLRREVERGHSVESWADGVSCGDAMTSRSPRREGRRNLRLRGPPALAAAAAARTRLGRPLSRPARGRAGRGGASSRPMTAKGVPVEGSCASASISTRWPSRRIVVRLIRRRPAVLHTHLVHADFYGLLAGTLARVPVLAARSTASTSFGRAAGWRSPIARSAGSRTCTSQSRAGSRDYLAEIEGFAPTSSTSSTTGSRPGPSRRPMKATRHASWRSDV